MGGDEPPWPQTFAEIECQNLCQVHLSCLYCVLSPVGSPTPLRSQESGQQGLKEFSASFPEGLMASGEVAPLYCRAGAPRLELQKGLLSHLMSSSSISVGRVSILGWLSSRAPTVPRPHAQLTVPWVFSPPMRLECHNLSMI